MKKNDPLNGAEANGGAMKGVPEACRNCGVFQKADLQKLGESKGSDGNNGRVFTVALAGNPNTGKSTVFNSLTGLRQHTGNWPGKTVETQEGMFRFRGQTYRLVDLPGTYSLLSTSPDEQSARDYLLFGSPDVTVVVLDATRLERNLNLLLQIRAITGRVVVGVNLMDEARRHGIGVDLRQLARDLGVPVVGMSARQGEGMNELLEEVGRMTREGGIEGKVLKLPVPERMKSGVAKLVAGLKGVLGDQGNLGWIAMRLLSGDSSIYSAMKEPGEFWAGGNTERGKMLAGGGGEDWQARVAAMMDLARDLRAELPRDPHEALVEEIYAKAERIAARCVTRDGARSVRTLDARLDRILTSRVWGYPVMVLMLTLVMWLTIEGANYPSRFLSWLLVDEGREGLRWLLQSAGITGWISGFVVDGVYLATAWVVSVMLPPMAIFFPIFTLLEDFGYLPRVAFNLDGLFRRAGAHGKQALSLAMGFGCNAAGVVAARIIDSPRERLIAILTNNFSLCNGRWPTQFVLATIFIGALVPPQWAGLASALGVSVVALLGVVAALGASWALSRSVLKGEVSTFHLELPPYRPPRFWRTLATSLVDRTLIVLWRAVVFALPAGAVIWIISNVNIGGIPAAGWAVEYLDPFAMMLGLNGIILLAYVVAIPANEIVLPSILMFTALLTGIGAGHSAGAGVMFEVDSADQLGQLLRGAGWTTLTAVNLMLFSLLHNPCSTTIYTIYRETRSVKWTVLATLLPLGMGFAVTYAVATVVRCF